MKSGWWLVYYDCMRAGFEDLRVYQTALDCVEQIHQLCKSPLIAKDYSLIDQIRRASMSIVVNIAEGYGRNTHRDFSQFLSIAIGSSNEVIAFLQIIHRLYPTIETTVLQDTYQRLGRQLYAFRNSLKSTP